MNNTKEPNHHGIQDEILAGPILRRTESQRLVIWLATRTPVQLRLQLYAQEHDITKPSHTLQGLGQGSCVQVGAYCHIQLLDLSPTSSLPTGQAIAYDLQWAAPGATDWHSMAQWGPHLRQDGLPLPRFIIQKTMQHLLHGSCRKPHYPAADGLVTADTWLQQVGEPAQWPGALLLTGDQVYVDDVAGPMLHAIHQLSDALGLYPETLEAACVQDSQSLRDSPAGFYHRHDLLPDTPENRTLRSRFFEGARKPVFTTSNADNHLITLAEMLAMYLLVWSPVPWRGIQLEAPKNLSAIDQERYQRELIAIRAFVDGLPQAQRLLAHLPTFMIFDDHDITDDWNLTADWEHTAYQHPFSRRIIGNALTAYFLCQGWGNNPDVFRGATLDLTRQWSSKRDNAAQDTLIEHLLQWPSWHYSLPTTPVLMVLDTRTRRWRSESHPNRPSGLMDWETLCELQTELLDHPAAIIVSPTPVFGVKLIEAIQKIFTWAGRPLVIDAENWMAHPGTANTILNIFRHTKTPAHYVILSGDVHYSFMYGVRLRSQRHDEPHIWQITSSGIKNQFPSRLLDVLDRLNRWLYAPKSPLNWLTRRRRMEVQPCKPSTAARGERLLNQAGIGRICLAPDGKPELVEQICADQTIAFLPESAD